MITYLDLYSRLIVSWDLRRTQKAEDMVEVLQPAIAKRQPNPGLIIHSDKGTQMRSKVYREYLTNNNIVFSYTSIDHSCDENAIQESFHSLLKREWLYQRKIADFNTAYTAIEEYIDGFYNTKRIHSALGYVTPKEYDRHG